MLSSGALSGRKLLAVVVLSALIGLIGGAAAAWGIYQRLGPAKVPVPVLTGGAASASQPALSSIVADRSASVVTVLTQPVSVDSLLSAPSGFANGFVAGGDGLVLTSARAVQGATLLRIALPDGRAYDAVVAASDLRHGLVVLQASGAHDLPALSFAAHPPRVGDAAVALAHPPLGSISVVAGSVSAVGRTLSASASSEPGGTSVVDTASIDAVAGPDYEGAPLLDGSGAVIGVVTSPAKAGQGGLVALSGRAAAAAVDRLTHRAGGSQGSFGADAISVDAATGAVSNLPQGALIRSVTPGGAAAEAGLGPGDVVTAVDGVAVDADHPFDAVALGLDPGQRVRLTVISRGKARSADIVVARAASGNGETAP